MTPIASADELSPGTFFDLGGFTLTREEVLDFAGKYDPQPFHLDEEAAKHSIFGRLVASGLHTYSATVGHLIRTGILSKVSQGGGAAELSWPAPLAPEEPVRVRVAVEALRNSRSRPDLAIATLRYLVTKEADGVSVLEVKATHFLRR